MRSGIFLTLVTALLPLSAERVAQDLLVRLRSTITTTAKEGTPFDAVITGCVRADCVPLLPIGSTLHGRGIQVQTVGIGVRRERAGLQLEFDSCTLPDGAAQPCKPQLISLDNAQETVLSGNRVEGILAAAHPHSLLGTFWGRPTSAIISRSLSGVSGRMFYTGTAPHPILAGAIIVSRITVFRLPDPEIHLPTGTEMILRVFGDAPEVSPVPSQPVISSDLASWLKRVHTRVTLPDGNPATDIINFAFRGTKAEISQAFIGAGWVTADPLTRRSFVRSYTSYTSFSSYPTAPVSPLRYQGEVADLVFQKSFNTMSKRHHIRLWEVESPDGPLWLGAATHDISLAFDWKRLAITHRIDVSIDRERDKILADLNFAGCISVTESLERPRLATYSQRLVTDGALQFIAVQPCLEPTSHINPTAGKKRTPVFKGIARQAVLESRHYFLRGNVYYLAYRGLRSRPVRAFFTKSKPTLAAFRRD